MAIPLNDLKILMRHYISEMTPSPDDTWRHIPEDKPIGKLLPKGGFPRATPEDIFESLVRRLLSVNGNGQKDWPSNWPSQSVTQLAAEVA